MKDRNEEIEEGIETIRKAFVAGDLDTSLPPPRRRNRPRNARPLRKSDIVRVVRKRSGPAPIKMKRETYDRMKLPWKTDEHGRIYNRQGKRVNLDHYLTTRRIVHMVNQHEKIYHFHSMAFGVLRKLKVMLDSES